MHSKTPEQRYDRLAFRLSVIISRLLSGEILTLKGLAEEFGVSTRTLRRDIHQRLLHLDIVAQNGTWRLRQYPLRDHTPGAMAFARNTGVAAILPLQTRQLMQMLMDENGTAPCLIGHGLPTDGVMADCFMRLVEAIYQHRVVHLLASGTRYSDIEPYRLIYQHSSWYLVATQHNAIRVFKMDDIHSVSLIERHFIHQHEISERIIEEAFINALPHFHFISHVVQRVNTHPVTS